jgi:4-amino-4-deoxy-L-arabinose transferase-like glycosyltransferase
MLKPLFSADKTARLGRLLLLIIAASIGLRVVMALYLGNTVNVLPGTQDQVSYNTLAQRVLAGHGFSFETAWWPATRPGEPTAHWSFLYTLFLAGVYGLVGYWSLLPRLLQAVSAGVLMPWLVYRLGTRHFGAGVGLVSAALAAVYLYFIYYAAALMTETFYIVAVLWVMDRAGFIAGRETGPRWPQWLHLGLAMAVAVLLRQVFLLIIPVLALWLLWRAWQNGGLQQARAWFAGLALAAVVVVLAIVPWTVRNYYAFDSFVLLNTNAGFAFFWGNHPIHGYNFVSILGGNMPSYFELIPPHLLPLNEADLDRALLKEAAGFITADPVRYLVLSASRAKDYFMFWPSADSSLISNLSRVLSFGWLWPFMAFGFFHTLRRAWSTPTLVLHLFVAAYTAIHLLSWALIRYRLPVDAVLLVFAGVAMAKLPAKIFSSPPVGRPIPEVGT